MAVPTAPQGYTVPALGRAWLPSGVDDGEDAPELRWPSSIAVYARMEREDPQIESALAAALLPIKRTSWRIEQGNSPADVAEGVARDLGLPLVGRADVVENRQASRFSFGQHLAEALTALVFGHSFFEQQYEWDKAAGRFRLRKLGWRPPATLGEIVVASDGGLVGIRQSEGGKLIGVNRLVAYAHDRRGGNWLGRSMLRPMYKPWILKDRMLRVGSETVERNGMGVPIYEASKPSELITTPEYDERQKTEIADGLKLATGVRSGSTAGASIAHGASLRMAGVDGNLPDAKAWVQYYDDQINRAVLAHFLNLGQKTGSWALGSTFADFFALGLQSIAKDFASVFQQHVIDDMVDVNWGTGTPSPRLVFDEIGSTSPVTAEALQSLLQTGAIVADDPLERFVRHRFQLPDPDPATARPLVGGQGGGTESSTTGIDTKAEAEEKAIRATAAGTTFRMGATPESAAAVFGLDGLRFVPGATSVSIKTPGEDAPPEPDPEEGQ